MYFVYAVSCRHLEQQGLRRLGLPKLGPDWVHKLPMMLVSHELQLEGGQAGRDGPPNEIFPLMWIVVAMPRPVTFRGTMSVNEDAKICKSGCSTVPSFGHPTKEVVLGNSHSFCAALICPLPLKRHQPQNTMLAKIYTCSLATSTELFYGALSVSVTCQKYPIIVFGIDTGFYRHKSKMTYAVFFCMHGWPSTWRNACSIAAPHLTNKVFGNNSRLKCPQHKVCRKAGSTVGFLHGHKLDSENFGTANADKGEKISVSSHVRQAVGLSWFYILTCSKFWRIVSFAYGVYSHEMVLERKS